MYISKLFVEYRMVMVIKIVGLIIISVRGCCFMVGYIIKVKLLDEEWFL